MSNTGYPGKKKVVAGTSPGYVDSAAKNAAETKIGEHEAHIDPHPQYVTQAEGDAAYATAGHTHAVTHDLTSHPDVAPGHVPGDLLQLKAAQVWEDVVNADNPRFWYRLAQASGDAVDDKATGPTLTAAGSISYNQASQVASGDPCVHMNSPESGGGASFSSDVETGLTYAEMSSAFTLECLVRRTGDRTGSAFDGTTPVRIRRSDLAAYFELDNNPTNNPKWRAAFGSGGLISPGTQCILNTWYHLVLTWSSPTLRFYINGSLVGTSTPAIPAAGANHSNDIGWRGDSGFGFWRGNVDEVLVYTTALSAARVTEHYNKITAVAGQKWTPVSPQELGIIPPGGTTGQSLKKLSDVDYDYGWVT